MCNGPHSFVPKENDPPRSVVLNKPIDMEFAKKAIAPRIRQMVESTNSHMRAADVEASKSKQMHALTRHGFQTGWMGQLLRICSKLTPDQEYDPLGVLPIETKLDVHTRDKALRGPDGRPSGDVMQVPMKNRTGGGQAAGMFYNPEVQHELMVDCLTVAKNQAKPYSECEVQLVTGELEWRPYNFIHVYLVREGGAGVAFALREGAPRLKPEPVIAALNTFMSSAREAPGQPPKYPTWGALLDELKVDQVLRNGCRTEINMKGADPCVMTMMPESVGRGATGFAPTSLVLQRNETARFKGAKWTGRLRNPQTGAAAGKPVPCWAEPF